MLYVTITRSHLSERPVKSTILLVGLGGLGSVLLELLAREDGIGRIVVASRNAERGAARCNLARLGALAQGRDPDIRFAPLDLHELDAIADLIRHEVPDVIVSTATRMTWWLPDLLPAPQADAVKRAGFGMWLPIHLTLTRRLMDAVRAAGYAGHTLTAPFPDVVNPVLARLGLAPTCGIGNLDEIVPKVRVLAAERLQVPVAEIEVSLVAHHALDAAALGGVLDNVPPYFVRVEHEGRDVTGTLRAQELLLAPYPITAGTATHFLTAGSAVRLIRALLSERQTRLHAPAPNGLPGGYPILASREGVAVTLPTGLSLEDAVALNERSHRVDGIERIENDGTAVFLPEMVDTFRKLLGYDCGRLPPDEADGRADELIARFRTFAKRLGVTLPA
jgi:hypothetical protein